MTPSHALLANRSLPVKAAMILAGSALIALSVRIEVPMYPVPMTLQTLMISLIGLTYGARLAALTVLAYLAQGALGLPVFSGGNAGLGWLMGGPTAGFLWGFVAMAWATGWLAERLVARDFLRLFVAAVVPALLLYVPGTLWLHAATSLDLGGAIARGALPFVLGDLVKSLIAAMMVAGGWKAATRLG